MEGKGRIFFQKEVAVFSGGREEEREIGRGEKNPLESVSLKLQDPGGSGQGEGVSTVCLSSLQLLFLTNSPPPPTVVLHSPPHIPDPHSSVYSHVCS